MIPLVEILVLLQGIGVLVFLIVGVVFEIRGSRRAQQRDREYRAWLAARGLCATADRGAA